MFVNLVHIKFSIAEKTKHSAFETRLIKKTKPIDSKKHTFPVLKLSLVQQYLWTVCIEFLHTLGYSPTFETTSLLYQM